MNKYPRIPAGLVLTTIVLLVLAGIPAQAKDGNTHSERAQAVLHIRINIVQTVRTPPPRGHHHDHDDDMVIYNVSTEKSDMDVREEIRALPAGVGERTNGDGAVLKTLTIVVR
jgi:hypothetical protein